MEHHVNAGQLGALVLAIVVVVTLLRSVRIIPQARMGIVQRVGRYSRTLDAGIHVLIPYVDKLLPLVDMREQVVSFDPQSVITSDNVGVSVDSVIYFQVNDARASLYEIADYVTGAEQLTATTLRNVIGGMSLEEVLTSRDEINGQLRGVLDEATNKWGLRVNRVELKTIDPPGTIKEAMEKQMRAERDKRAAILTAEGDKQSAILSAEGERQAAILRAQGDQQSAVLSAEGNRQSEILIAEGKAKAIETVFAAIHRGQPDDKLLAYQYIQTLPLLAAGEGNKTWIIPAELTAALKSISGALSGGPKEPPAASG
jgi:regulator of protease activity HflC (stomatin/prohibitin superfamily)